MTEQPRMVLSEVRRALATLDPEASVEMYVWEEGADFKEPWGDGPLPEVFPYAVFVLSKPLRPGKHDRSQAQITQAALAHTTGEMIATCLVEAVTAGISREEVLNP